MANDFVPMHDDTFVRRSAITRFQLVPGQDSSFNSSASESGTGTWIVNVFLTDRANGEWVTAFIGEDDEQTQAWVKDNLML